jgi:hypothetical protein
MYDSPKGEIMSTTDVVVPSVRRRSLFMGSVVTTLAAPAIVEKENRFDVNLIFYKGSGPTVQDLRHQSRLSDGRLSRGRFRSGARAGRDRRGG